MLQNNIKQFTF